jgi:hypothetical protein
MPFSHQKGLFASFSFAIILILAPFAILRVGAQGVGSIGLSLRPTSGVTGEHVQITLNISKFLEERGDLAFLNLYSHKTFDFAWDIGGWSRDPADWNTVHTATLQIIGNGVVDFMGFLNGTASIPEIRSSEMGEHIIYAVYHDRDSGSPVNYWWQYFEVTGVGSHDYSELVVDIDKSRCQVRVSGPPIVDSNEVVSGDQKTTYYYMLTGSDIKVETWSSDATRYVFNETWVTFPDRSTQEYDTPTITFTLTGRTLVEVFYDERWQPTGPVCIIATATYGSPLAEEVVFMRSVRDDMIGSNRVGSVLVEGWNTFYYSWSPPLARAIADSTLLKAAFKVLLLPLLGTMHVVAFQYKVLAPVSPELASIVGFATAAFLAIGVYLFLPSWFLSELVRRKVAGKTRA